MFFYRLFLELEVEEVAIVISTEASEATAELYPGRNCKRKKVVQPGALCPACSFLGLVSAALLETGGVHVCIHVPYSACLRHTYTGGAQKSPFEYSFMCLDKRWRYAGSLSAEWSSLKCSVEFSDNAVECF